MNGAQVAGEHPSKRLRTDEEDLRKSESSACRRLFACEHELT